MQNLTTEQTIVLEAVYTILERNAQASMIKRFLDLLTPEAKKTYIEILT